MHTSVTISATASSSRLPGTSQLLRWRVNVDTGAAIWHSGPMT